MSESENVRILQNRKKSQSALNISRGRLLVLNNLADRNVANLVESQIKYELCLIIMRLHKNIYIIHGAKKKIYWAKNKRILDTNRIEIQPPLHTRPRVNQHQRPDPRRHERRDEGQVQLLKEAPHRTQQRLQRVDHYPSCPQFLSL